MDASARRGAHTGVLSRARSGGGKRAEPGSLLQWAEELLISCWLGFFSSYLRGEVPRVVSPLFITPQLGSCWELWMGKRIQGGEGCGGGFALARQRQGWHSPGAPGSPRFGAS